MAEETSSRVFDHVLVIMFENQYRSYVLQNPFMRKLAKKGILLSNYFGVMHPSQTNYIASIAGELCNVTSDGVPPLIEARTIVDLIEEAPKRLRWKAYMDSYVKEAAPWAPGFSPKDRSPYLIKHNPFSSFANIVKSEARWKRIESDATLFSDLLNGQLPEYAWYTPNIWNDGHWINGTEEESVPRAPALVNQLAGWLEGFFGKLRFPGPRSHLPPRTLVVVTFDESDFEADYLPNLASTYDGPNQVYTVLLGDMIKPCVEKDGYNHYSLLRTIEINFGLGHLGKNDAEANWFQFLWHRRFQWSGPQKLSLPAQGPLCLAGFSGALYLAYRAADGTVRVRSRKKASWSMDEVLPVDGAAGIGMASTANELVLVACAAGGSLQYLTFTGKTGWSKPISLPGEPNAQALALSAFDGGCRIMAAWKRMDGEVETLVWKDGKWGAPMTAAAAKTDGAISLGVLGASLYLIVKTPGARTLNMISYNFAPFNVVTVPVNPYGGPQDNTTLDAWSPSAFPVAHFSARPEKNLEWKPITQDYECGDVFALATLDGVMHLVHPSATNPALVTETFSISGVMTPTKPVSYKKSDSAEDSNGFGTLAEAGWSLQTPIAKGRCRKGGALAMAALGKEIVLISRADADSPLEIRSGTFVKVKSKIRNRAGK